MSNWAATNELRFVDKTIKQVDQTGIVQVVTTVRALQQKWETIARRDPTKDYEILSEWRDVPVVEER